MDVSEDTFQELRDKAFAVAVDAHTAGEPIRIILHGYKDEMLSKDTMLSRQNWIKENDDEFRTRTMQEPRGHAAMFGAIITEPTGDEADVGVLFPYPSAYADMCGHGSLGVATVLLELGIIDPQQGKNKVTLDTPAGLVDTVAHYEDGRVKKVDLFGTPSFFQGSTKVNLDGAEEVEVDLSFGGNFFGIVKVDQFGLSIKPEDLSKLNEIAHKIMKRINDREDMSLVHPKTGELPLERIRFVGGKEYRKNVVIHEGAVIDRSPCGTGTCSQLAWEYFQGDINLGERNDYSSIIGTEFRGEAVEEKTIDGIKTIVPKVTGSSYITGLNYFITSEGDPLIDGFRIDGA